MIDSNSDGPFRYPVSDAEDQDQAPAGITPSQTVGPYVHIGLSLDGTEDLLAGSSDEGEPIDVTFTIIDGEGQPIADAMVEIWQPDGAGVFNSPLDPRTGADATVDGFRGLGRAMADDTGTATFRTIRPGVPELDGVDVEAPHLKVGVFARGMLERLYTRMYFPDNDEANAADPVLALVAEDRRGLLVAHTADGGYHLDIRMQDDDPARETPFFAL
ncbi:protocatechuate 3,4-dioxygenase subunit alpha [uncultured Corynebacterium sp.]|uniref:protocatechuate 3,4-dioxygenase subunit alpha n=1 Tax=uncultured Corynebacterium sp. TaxID=159447 RepID=UPI0025D1E8D2|nr:protocatechuate 3,4-dioxygenase subunit alpha [uncultured Corynebacterium sp.]